MNSTSIFTFILGKFSKNNIRKTRIKMRLNNTGNLFNYFQFKLFKSELQKLQMKNFDEREDQKRQERLEKILYEKRSRDKQLEDETRKKRDDRRKEKELD